MKTRLKKPTPIRKARIDPRMNITNDKVTDYINSFYEPVDTDMLKLREESERDNIPLILKETEDFLRVIISIVKPKNILEIGTAYGYSAIYFAKCLEDSAVTTIEKSAEMQETAKKNFARYDLEDRVRSLLGDASAVLDDMISDDSRDKFDFVFIDAAKSHYRDFFDRAEALCVPGAVIICDNVLMKASIVDRTYDKRRRHRTSIKRMKEFLNYLYEREDLTVSLLRCGDGLAIIKLNGK